MARRRGLLHDLFSLAAALPWWVGLALAPASFALLRNIAAGTIAFNQIHALSSAVAQSAVIGTAQFGQWAVPSLFLAGSAASAFRTVKAARLVAGLARGGPVTWREFETLVGEIYRQQGYRVSETPDGPDGGVDLVLRRDNERLLVQCKHWQAQLVDVRVVRELKGVMAAEGASGGAVVTSGKFTHDATEFARRARIDLIDGKRLKALARSLDRTVSSDSHQTVGQLPPERAAQPPRCPSCDSIMLLRTAKRGSLAGQRFWGCSTYPKCRGTRPIES